MVWALEQRRKWREQWRKEGVTDALVELSIKYCPTAEANPRMKQWIERTALEHGIDLDVLPPQFGSGTWKPRGSTLGKLP